MALLDIETDTEKKIVVHCRGTWDTLHVGDVRDLLETLAVRTKDGEVVFDLSNLLRLDSGGALLLLRIRERLRTGGCTVTFLHAGKRHGEMLAMAERYRHPGASFETKPPGVFESVGRAVAEGVRNGGGLLDFIGHTFAVLAGILIGLKRLRMRETLFQINESAIKALWIIALTMFLVGIVVAYQSAVQLKTYGANIFIVDMLGISIMRELAPMLTAIVVAGRSGSAFAAQIGVMKLTEEIDAMRTMGFDPYAFLVLPRMLALVVMMPILIFFADMFGILGGMLIAHTELGITPGLFLDRFESAVHIKHFWVGIIKGPFFAVLIAAIGIYRGMSVRNDTESIGINTTRSVVESIFTVIICDAVFSIIFTHLGF